MILILGKNGQVGNALSQLLGAEAVAFDASEINLTQPDFTDKLSVLLSQHEFTTIINAAAYTAVDKAESEPTLAMRINGAAVGELALWCKKHDVRLVHYSTDYVFDGSGSHARSEDETPAPLNIYGKSKLLGEQLIAASGAECLIIRTSWVYDGVGKNFFTTMLRLFKEREEISVVADQIGAPTYARHLAQATLNILIPLPLREGLGEGWLPQNAALNLFAPPPTPTLPLKGGGSSNIYHLCNSGETSWHGFASAILALMPNAKCKTIRAIPSAEYSTPAKRPLNSRLSCSKAKNTFSLVLPHWQDALKECYEDFGLRH